MSTPTHIRAISVTLLFVGLLAFAVQTKIGADVLQHGPAVSVSESDGEVDGKELLDTDLLAPCTVVLVHASSFFLTDRWDLPLSAERIHSLFLSRGPPALLV
ncbi:hypothetical protein [Lignipirellula cremea]|uniref:Uncharacterized protein n=1 Tax=Lignipirellula cremea TaxID=2528010 RepID=A0A518E4J1_9BACT|nr:hypothetical protein [Lignipirellula cremea]QDU98994.1 hypothetical protein Pla8534_69050 [Lignipirellula cremea]